MNGKCNTRRLGSIKIVKARSQHIYIRSGQG